MLVLSRKPNESIVIEGGIRITVVSIRGNQVRLGFEAPGEVGIYREELLIPAEERQAAREARQAPPLIGMPGGVVGRDEPLRS